MPVAVSVPQAEAAGAGKGIKHIDPARYGDLVHPGDAFSYDIYTQVARALRSPKGVDVLGPLTPKRVLAVGESQSAFALTTYVDGVQPLTHEFDGFVDPQPRRRRRSRSASPGRASTSSSTISGAPDQDPHRRARRRSSWCRPRPTSSASSAPTRPASATAPASAGGRSPAPRTPTSSRSAREADALGCPAPVNDGPSRFVVRTALRDLDHWVRTGAAPPKAPRFAIDAATKTYVRDEWGNVKGGIRTPLVDAPVDTLSGESAGGSVVCILFGFTKPLTAEQLSARYRVTRRLPTRSTAPRRSGRSRRASCSPTTGPTS